MTNWTSSVSSDGSLESLAVLKDRLINFYKVYDPRKLEDETKVNEFLIWARKHSEAALILLIKRKYGVDIDNVDSSEEGWGQLHKDLIAYYRKHDRSKPRAEIDKIYRWTRQEGLAKLNERLVQKYGVPLASIQRRKDWKNRWKHLVANQELGNLADSLRAFYSKHDSSKTEADIEALAKWGVEHGRDKVNEILLRKYGETLDSVRLIEGSTSDERAYNLRKKLYEFYKVHDPEKATDEVLDAVCEWGMKSYEELNEQLLMHYGFNLDTKTVDPEELKLELFDFFSSIDPTNRHQRPRGYLEKLVDFAVENGREALNQKLLYEYGAMLSSDREHAAVLAQQTPKMGTSRKSLRNSLKNALRKSLSWESKDEEDDK